MSLEEDLMECFYISPRSVGVHPDLEQLRGIDGVAVVERAGALPEGVPFFLDEEMRPFEPLCSYFFELAKFLKPTTMGEYARDLMDLTRFLAELDDPADLLSATEDDLVAYRLDRTERQDEPVSKATWRRRRVAINGFYDWAVDQKLIAERPYFKRRGGRDALYGGAAPELDVRPLTFPQWRFFKQVGMLGCLPDGSPDPTFRGRDRLRNAAVAELAITTGMRLREFRCLLDIEVGPSRADRGAAVVELQEIAKYGQFREVRIHHQALCEIDLYRRTERAATVQRAARTLWGRRAELFVVGDIDTRRMRVTGVLDGRRRSFAVREMGEDLRRRAVIEGDRGLEPMALFIGRGAKMPVESRWEQVFDAAHVRALRVARESGSAPEMPRRLRIHDLRHTFAVYMLQLLTELTIAEGVRRDREGRPDAYLSEHMMKNPLLTLQDLLGHRRVESTLHYVRYVKRTNALVAWAVAQWQEADRTYADYAQEAFARVQGAL
jgi:integrase